MNWFNRLLPPKIKRKTAEESAKKGVPEGLWRKCAGCEVVLYAPDLESQLYVCSACGHHHPMPVRRRLTALLDEGYEEVCTQIVSKDPLRFKDTKKYTERLHQAQATTGEKEALIVVQGTMQGIPVVCAVFNFAFLGGSMGSVVGEKFVRGVRLAIEKAAPFICLTSSGGARMQEGMHSLMQMLKTTAAVTRLAEERLPFVTILTHPTMGGVSASFAFIADIVVAEPKALIGFAGPRVIEQTVREKLPDDFQRAEFLLKKGALDCIMDRRQMKVELSRLLSLLLHRPL